jgi:hypothetical protein
MPDFEWAGHSCYDEGRISEYERKFIYCLEEALKKRRVGINDFNNTSSRSHLIFRFQIRKEDGDKRVNGTLVIVDLAGHEGVKKNFSNKVLSE